MIARRVGSIALKILLAIVFLYLVELAFIFLCFVGKVIYTLVS